MRDRRVSPLYGDLSGLTNVTVFAGTCELFYPDIVKCFDMLEQQNNILITGDYMNHVFPLLPIPEAKAADEKIFAIIKR